MISFVIVALCLVVIIWIASMYISWKISEGNVPANIKPEALVVSATDKTTRLTRRGWYMIILYAKRIWAQIVKYVRRGFLKLVPSAKEAFGEKEPIDPNDGPSSHFLKEIAKAKDKVRNRLSKDKKML